VEESSDDQVDDKSASTPKKKVRCAARVMGANLIEIQVDKKEEEKAIHRSRIIHTIKSSRYTC